MAEYDFNQLKALFINCTLKKSPRTSHTRGLMQHAIDLMEREGVDTQIVRLVDHDVPPGVYPDMREYGWEKDEWESIFNMVMAADILVIGSPIWLGEKSSEAKKLIERLYAMSGKQNEKGQYIYYGKTAGCVITGNEDGIKHCSSSILYALQHIGFTIPPQADCGWIGEVGPGPSYLDEESNAINTEFTNRTLTFMCYNLMHMATMLKNNGGIPNYGNSVPQWNKGERWAFRKT
ncbi:flavodoxin family protein [Robertkochia aurantiaca]|uniref:flavodoxin family protein n=1 Tax=Robertkochia aurantiaca TaxID=2873700 RepID=UPI001CCFEA4F|nr:NAD(P)H-dependent oxidoreductase [Robertkochia sp. 3YJGBD-33]